MDAPKFTHTTRATFGSGGTCTAGQLRTLCENANDGGLIGDALGGYATLCNCIVRTWVGQQSGVFVSELKVSTQGCCRLSSCRTLLLLAISGFARVELAFRISSPSGSPNTGPPRAAPARFPTHIHAVATVHAVGR